MKKYLFLLLVFQCVMSSSGYALTAAQRLLPGMTTVKEVTIVAAEYRTDGIIYTSTNGGSTWTSASISGMSTGHSAWGIGVASDTGYIIMQSNGAAMDGIWFSKNNGSSFTENSTYASPYKLGVSAPSGGILYASGGGGGAVQYTTDGGTTISQWTGLDDGMTDVAASTDGTYIVRVRINTTFPPIKYSTNSGSSFSASTISGGNVPFYSVAMNASGSYIYACRYNSTDHLFISTDYGANFSSSGFNDGISNVCWVRTNSTGQYLLMVVGYGKTYVNNNYGDSSSWTEVITGTSTECGIGTNSVSPSGKYMVLGDTTSTDTIHYSENYGVTWTTKSTGASSYVFRGVAITE